MSKAKKSKANPEKPIKPRSREREAAKKVEVAEGAIDPGASLETLREALGANHFEDHAITDLMLHCAAVLTFRRAAAGSNSRPGLCYKGVGGSDGVTLYQNGFPVERCTRQEAEARHIAACG
jgi:hypothetical protein